MPRQSTVRKWERIATTILLLAITACSRGVAGDGPESSDDAGRAIEAAALHDPQLAEELQDIRSATEKYKDVEVALADGYLPDPTNMCVTAEMEGAPRQLGQMGIHYFRPDLLGLTGTEPRVSGMGMHTDFHEPGVLIYEPRPDGSLQLVAIENLIWAAPWQGAGNTRAPEYMGNDYYFMVDNPTTGADEAHGFEPHYELHMWLYRENPTGLFTPFNPNVSCDHHSAEHH